MVKMTCKETFKLKIEDVVFIETVTVYKGLYWYNLDYWHPKMKYEDGATYIKGLINFVMRFSK